MIYIYIVGEGGGGNNPIPFQWRHHSQGAISGPFHWEVIEYAFSSIQHGHPSKYKRYFGMSRNRETMARTKCAGELWPCSQEEGSLSCELCRETERWRHKGKRGSRTPTGVLQGAASEKRLVRSSHEKPSPDPPGATTRLPWKRKHFSPKRHRLSIKEKMQRII